MNSINVARVAISPHHYIEIGKRADVFCQPESSDAGVLLSRMRHGVCRVPRLTSV